jgi:alpha,alpha-trehalase
MVRSSAARSAVLLLALAAAAEPLQPILTYIRTTWGVLTRSNRTLAESAADPKFRPGADGRWPVYISRQEDLSRIGQQLRTQMDVTAFEKTAVRRLPEAPNTITEQGLLYLPLPYVVPGGRFNEMYGWGSYFIQLGLLRDDMTDLARNMADNFLYEIKNYGWILNANRTYYLTRSQPPFLTEMLLNVYRQTHDLQWLEHALTEVETYYQYWTREPHLTPQTGLSRYFNLGEGPAPEVMASERDSQGRTHYGRARQYFRTHKVSDYDASQYYDRWNDRLTPAFYKGDRSMRESGFDPSERFGALNVDITHYNPVCLNSLLYVQEIKTAEMLRDIGRDAGAALWQSRADTRAERINRLMWDAGGGLHYDYDFSRKRVRHYPFLTTFYPLVGGHRFTGSGGASGR